MANTVEFLNERPHVVVLLKQFLVLDREDPDLFHLVTRQGDGWACSCPDYQHARRCDHPFVIAQSHRMRLLQD
jgi:hypothetical protein